MVATCGDRGGGSSVAEVDGVSWGVGAVCITELTVTVVSPARDVAVVEECAGVLETGGDSGGRSSVTEINCYSWSVGAVVATVSELSVPVVPPACDRAVVEECAGVVGTGGDGGGGASVTEINC